MNRFFMSQKLRIVFLYSLSFGFILSVPNAVYWDDWTLFNVDFEYIVKTFSEAGAIFSWPAYLHIGLYGLGAWAYKVLTFICFLLSGFCLYSILEKQIKGLDSEIIFIVVSLFLLLPLNTARIAAIDFPYALCYLLFFYAWAVIDKHKYLSLFLFFLSFNTNSLLVFYALPIGLQLLKKQPRSFIGIINFIRSNVLFLILPFLYFLIKKTWFVPYGRYEGYNGAYNLAYVEDAIIMQFRDMANFHVNILLVAILWGILFLTIPNFSFSKRPNLMYSISGFFIGIIAIILAGFPYWIIYKIPTFVEWTSRHQLLFPLGIAIILAVALSYLPALVKRVALALILSVSIAYNIQTYYSFKVDWNKQKQIINYIKDSRVIRNANLIVFKDNAREFNAIERSFRFYEFNGWLKLSSNNENRFGLYCKQLDAYQSGQYDNYFLPHYNAGKHIRNNDSGGVVVVISQKKPSSLFEEIFYPKIELTAYQANNIEELKKWCDKK